MTDMENNKNKEPIEPIRDTWSEENSHQEALEAQHKLRQLEEQVAVLKDHSLRALADTENARKRHEKELEDLKKFAVSNFSKDLINVLENLYRSTEYIKEEDKANENVKKIFDGVELTKEELVKVFNKYGITRISPKVGEAFDHHFHQAVSQVSDPKLEINTVAQVIQAGYVLYDRLIRPALVVVSL